MRATESGGAGYESFAELREGLVFRRLRLLKFLGAGATAQVWMAQNVVTGQNVAVKISSRVHDDADPAATRDLQRFFYEARLGARLSRVTPHVVSTIDAGVQGGLPYLVMELGEPLTRRRMAPFDAARVITHVARALEAAHGSSVIHRDVKPANILKMRPPSGSDDCCDCTFKLGDYGIARPFYKGGPIAPSRADEIVLIGTPAYMCPDAICGEAPTGGDGDIWALAVTAYELATGMLPFDANTWFHLAEEIVKGHFRPLPADVAAETPELVPVFARAFAVSRRDRYETARELAAAYVSALTGRHRLGAERAAVGLGA